MRAGSAASFCIASSVDRIVRLANQVTMLGERLPPGSTHELYSTLFKFPDGPPTTSHELNGWGDNLVHEHLQAITVDGRVAVLYSNKDYSSEWSYHPQSKQFMSTDNTRFGVNVIVYALTR